jgi:hypothetical protein
MVFLKNVERGVHTQPCMINKSNLHIAAKSHSGLVKPRVPGRESLSKLMAV